MEKIRTLESNILRTTHRNSLKFCKAVFLAMITDFQQKKCAIIFYPYFFIYLLTGEGDLTNPTREMNSTH